MSWDEARIDRIRDRVTCLLAQRRLERYMLAVNWDALNDYYGFHGRCECLNQQIEEKE